MKKSVVVLMVVYLSLEIACKNAKVDQAHEIQLLRQTNDSLLTALSAPATLSIWES